MVDVEQRALRTLEQDALAGAPLGIEQGPDGVGEGQDLRRDPGELGQQFAAIDLGDAEAAAQRVVMGEEPLDLGRESRLVLEVDHADGAAADLVLIGRADAALGRADLQARIRGLAEMVELAVQRQDQRGIVGDAQVFRRDHHILLSQAADLLDEMPGIDHDAVADDRELARTYDAGGQKRELVDLAVDDERMAGIMAALEPNDDIGLARQPVDDLALALVAPLGADHHHIRHENLPLSASGLRHLHART